MYDVSHVVRRRHHLITPTVVGWKIGVRACVRAEGSGIVREPMVGTGYRSQWMIPKDVKRLCTTYHDYNVPGKLSYRIDNK